MGFVPDGTEVSRQSTMFREQCAVACEILTAEPFRATFADITGLWDVNRGTVWQHVEKFKEYNNNPGKMDGSALYGDIYEDLAKLTVDRDDRARPLTCAEIRRPLADYKGICIGHDKLCCLFHRLPRVFPVEATAMEEMRMKVTDEQILRHIGDLSSQINSVPAHFVFIMGEMSHQDWADRMDDFCDVSAE
jgi:hypothetical protein